MAKDILEMDANELRSLRDSLPDDHDPRELRLLSDRITEISIKEGLATGLALAKQVGIAEKMDEMAYSRYSGLKDTDSEFAKAVEKELKSRGDAETNERALLDSANSVAMDMGIVPESWKPSEGTINVIKGAGSRNDLGNESDSGGMSDNQKELMAGLVARGYLNPDDKESMARIDKATGGTGDE